MHILVIGYGNELRRDDGAGIQVVERVRQDIWPDVVVMSLHQLTPELADPLAHCDCALFVDTYVSPDGRGVQVQSLDGGEARGSPTAFSHTQSPEQLLTLAQVLYGHRPEAWWIWVPGVDFDLGEGFSPVAKAGIHSALEWIHTFLTARADGRAGSCMKLA